MSNRWTLVAIFLAGVAVGVVATLFGPRWADPYLPAGLRGPGGGIVMDGAQVAADHRVQLVGYGPSASTIGANRAGREAVRNLLHVLDVGR